MSSLSSTVAIVITPKSSNYSNWLSDTVAGSLLGYGIGRIFWESSRTPGRNRPNVIVDPSGIKLSWDIY